MRWSKSTTIVLAALLLGCAQHAAPVSGRYAASATLPASEARVSALPAPPVSGVPRAAATDDGVQVGEPFVDIGLRQLDFASGELAATLWLSSLVGAAPSAPARLLLLNFFASWCEPCFAELPELSDWQQRFQGRGLRILGLNVRTPPRTLGEEIASFRARLTSAPPFPLLFARYTTESTRLYLGSGTLALPAHVLIDADGRVLYRGHGAGPQQLAALRAEIERELEVPSASASP